MTDLCLVSKLTEQVTDLVQRWKPNFMEGDIFCHLNIWKSTCSSAINIFHGVKSLNLDFGNHDTNIGY